MAITFGASGLPSYITDAMKPKSSPVKTPSRVNTTTLAGVRAASKKPSAVSLPIEQRGVYIPVGAYRADGSAVSPATIAKANAINEAIVGPRRESTTTPVQQTTVAPAPVQTTPEPAPVPIVTEPGPADVAPAPAAPEPAPYNVYDDPFYQQALAAAQSQFNLARINALGDVQVQERGINRQLEQRIPAAEQARRRLAGNFAARGMGGGRYGALTRAEAELNAREIGARTGLREQIAELNRQFVSQFGAEGTDWLGTRAGYEAQQAAIQQALQNRLAGLTTVG